MKTKIIKERIERILGDDEVRIYRDAAMNRLFDDCDDFEVVQLKYSMYHLGYKVVADIERTVVIHELQDYATKVPPERRSWYVKPRKGRLLARQRGGCS